MPQNRKAILGGPVTSMSLCSADGPSTMSLKPGKRRPGDQGYPKGGVAARSECTARGAWHGAKPSKTCWCWGPSLVNPGSKGEVGKRSC